MPQSLPVTAKATKMESRRQYFISKDGRIVWPEDNVWSGVSAEKEMNSDNHEPLKFA